jgi:uncharacterized membrane protein YraQ (UPF0718 family)
MNQATLILIVLALVMLGVAWHRKDGSLSRGLHLSLRTVRRTLPLLLFAFLIVGYVNVLSPQELVRNWLGPETGVRGLLIGEVAGMLLPGGPYVIFPLVASLYETGAGLGPMLAMITSWSGLALLTASFELPFLGWRFSVIRIALSLPIPLLVGALGVIFWGA